MMKRLPALCAAIACAAMTLIGFSSCGKEDPEKPDAVVSNADWQDVSSSAGSLQKDGLTLDYPSGTFGVKDKVAITKIKSGSIRKTDEKSEFYQVTMPENGSAKPVTISIPYSGDPSEVRVAVRTLYYSISGAKFLKTTRIVESQYKNGAFQVTVPESYSNNDQNAQFTIGLVAADEKVADVKTKTPGKEWTYGWNLWFWEKSTYKPYREQIEALVTDWIPTAQSMLYARGFEIPPIYYEVITLDDEVWGGYHQPAFFKTKGYIQLNAKKLMAAAKDKESLDFKMARTTIIHETLHASHTIKYNPDFALPGKFWTLIGYEYTMFTEALAVWSEQFMRDPKVLSGSPVAEEENYLPFIRTFYPQGNFPGNRVYQDYGYAMAAFIQYLAKKTSQNSIVRLAQLQKEGKWGVSVIYDNFLDENKLDFFDTESYLDFALMYCKGDLVADIDYKRLNTGVACKNSAPVTLPYRVTGPKVYSCGFVPEYLSYKQELLKDYDDYSLSFEQLTDGLETHVWYIVGSSMVYAGKAVYDEPLLLPIATLNKERSQSVLTITVKSLMTNDDTYLNSSVLVSFEPPVPKPKNVRVSGKLYVSCPDVNNGAPTTSQVGGVLKETGGTFKSELRNKDKDLYVYGHYKEDGKEYWIQFDIKDYAKTNLGKASLADITFKSVLTGNLAAGVTYKNELSVKLQALEPKKGSPGTYYNSGKDLSMQSFMMKSTNSYDGKNSVYDYQFVKKDENTFTIEIEMNND